MNILDTADASAPPAAEPTIAQLAARIKQSVIGQDDAIDWLCNFIDAAKTRSRLLSAGIGDGLTLPNIGSALIVGPTASGKTHLVKTYAKASGMVFHSIDASTLSGEGWRGNSLSSEWALVARQLNERPGAIALVFIDEVDKLKDDVHERGFSPKYELLKPLDGGIIEGEDGSRERFSLDCDRCIFVFSGAFTGIERHIERRLGITKPLGFSPAPAGDAADATDDLRRLVTLEDIETWGFPRELVGRFSTVQFMGALEEDDLITIVKTVLKPRYETMLLGGTITVSDDAAEFMAKKALATNYGARSLNQQMNQLIFGPRWQSIAEAPTGMDAALHADGDRISCVVTPSERGVAIAETVRPAAMRPPACAFELLDAVARCDKERWASLDPCTTLSTDYSAYAASLLRGGADKDAKGSRSPVGPYSPAEATLLHSLLAFLHDWFPVTDFTPRSLTLLVGMTDITREDNSPLDLLYQELSTGKVYTKRAPSATEGAARDGQRDAGAGETPRATYEWQPSTMRRNRDGLSPAREGGLEPGQDQALDWYTAFKSFPREKQADAIKTLALRLMPVAYAVRA